MYTREELSAVAKEAQERINIAREARFRDYITNAWAAAHGKAKMGMTMMSYGIPVEFHDEPYISRLLDTFKGLSPRTELRNSTLTLFIYW